MWNPVPQPKYRVIFNGTDHFDYLYNAQLACNPPRGDCPYVGAFATDTVTMFFARFLQPELWPQLAEDIDDSLIPPTLDRAHREPDHRAAVLRRRLPLRRAGLRGELPSAAWSLRESPPPFEAGQLLFYRDTTRDGRRRPALAVGDRAGRLAGDEVRALRRGRHPLRRRPPGQLLFYRDYPRDGTGDVNSPAVIGLGGWQGMRQLFAGDPGRAVRGGRPGPVAVLPRHTRDGTGDVNTPGIIGRGGWQDMRHLTYGGDGIIYAIDSQGRLLFYRDHTRNGHGESTPRR